MKDANQISLSDKLKYAQSRAAKWGEMAALIKELREDPMLDMLSTPPYNEINLYHMANIFEGLQERYYQAARSFANQLNY